MPRRRPPEEIFTFPVPQRLARAVARCPACAGTGQAYGCVGARVVFKCAHCGVRFKVNNTAYGLTRAEPGER